MAVVEEENLKKYVRESGSLGYGPEEHVVLLNTFMAVPNSFNAGESSAEWREVYTEMLPFYDGVSAKPRESGTFHGHFCELYSALKSGIHLLSVLTKELLCPTFIENDNEEEFITYASKLYETLLSKPKTFKPWKWWSLEVVQLLLKLHVQSQNVYGSGKQDAATLAKVAQSPSKPHFALPSPIGSQQK
jgi:hypothetical protein